MPDKKKTPRGGDVRTSKRLRDLTEALARNRADADVEFDGVHEELEDHEKRLAQVEVRVGELLDSVRHLTAALSKNVQPD